ncbi:hypothetical protein C6B10_23240, partial [Escherichia coli]|uniref:hypothetical protein n=1 Tax=Escherichia coli TaxID=562 RepID=UPI000DEA07FA
ADRNRSHWSTSKTPSYTKSVSWQHHLRIKNYLLFTSAAISPSLQPQILVAGEKMRQYIQLPE